MAGWLRRLFAGSSRAHTQSDPRVFPFSSNQNFFKYQCENGPEAIRAGVGMAALICDPMTELSLAVPVVHREPDGCQRALLRIASPNGGFLVSSVTSGKRGPPLKSGDLVLWIPFEHLDEVGKLTGEYGFGWMGLIVATLRPEIIVPQGAMRIDQRFLE